REEQPAERYRLAAAVVNLKPVVTARRIGHPFVDTQPRDGAETGGAVARARSRHVERPGAGTVRDTAEREVGRLQAEADRVNQAAAVDQPVEQENQPAVSVQS